jgi:hypothetical protein
MKIELEFEFYYGNSWAELDLCSPSTNLKISISHVTDYLKIKTYMFDTESDNIVFKKTNKKDHDTVVENNVIVRDQYVKIKTIRIDNILIDQLLIQPCMVFVPQYPQGYIDYCIKHNTVPEEKLYDTEFYFNGTISFNFEIPFWPWYANLMSAREKKYMTPHQNVMYLGNDVASQQHMLEKLKAVLSDYV